MERKPFYKKWWVWLVAILVLGIGSMGGEDTNDDNALKKAQSYQETMSMSPEDIKDQFISEYGECFIQEEADYAIANLN